MGFNDFQEIQALVYSYAFLLDSGDFVGLGNLFAGANVYSSGTLVASRDSAAVAKAFRDSVLACEDGTARRTRHCISNLIVIPDGVRRACAKSYVMVFRESGDVPLPAIIGGDYVDRFLKCCGIWRFVERRMGNHMLGHSYGHRMEQDSL